MWNLKYGMNEPIYRRDTDSTDMEKELEEGWTESLELGDVSCYV